jgi:ABC-type branched-subunit amino acid transport system ATPase component
LTESDENSEKDFFLIKYKKFYRSKKNIVGDQQINCTGIYKPEKGNILPLADSLKQKPKLASKPNEQARTFTTDKTRNNLQPVSHNYWRRTQNANKRPNTNRGSDYSTSRADHPETYQQT